MGQFIDSNTSLNKLSSIPAGTPNRLLWTGSLPTTTNPVDNQRFFVWQQYNDYLPYDPDENGLDFWTGQMTINCGTGFNDNNPCVHTRRVLVSRAFYDVAFPSPVTNPQYVHLMYQSYLRRDVPDSDSGFQFWLNNLNQYGSPASRDGQNALIDAFIYSAEYRQRFGQP